MIAAINRAKRGSPGLTWIGTGFFLVCLFACKPKMKRDASEETFFPALSFLKSQVAHVDTSLYFIRKIVYIDSLHNDTIYLRREEFRNEARDFLLLPDISDSRYKKRYTETRHYDPMIGRVLLTYLPVEPEKEEIQRQEVLVKPDASGGKMTNIIVHSIINTRDSLVEKRLLWLVDKSFQVIITRQLPGQPQTTSTFKVIWNEEDQ